MMENYFSNNKNPKIFKRISLQNKIIKIIRKERKNRIWDNPII